MPGSKNWCFTLNNYEDSDVELYRAIGTERNGIRYLVFGKEVGEEGTRHLQCFVSFDARRSFKYVKDLFGNRIHCESAKGSPS